MDTRAVALLTPLSLADAQALGHGFGLDVASVEPLSLGSVNSNFRLVTRAGDRYFARIYEEQGVEGARAELRLLRGLDDQRVPVTVLSEASDIGGEAADAMREVRDTLADAVEESVHNRPFTTLAMALCAGFLIGAIWRR
jgi:ElaB/YqjD/DUF883 family membrane-anchored ribosome-binding protein